MEREELVTWLLAGDAAVWWGEVRVSLVNQ
jgi:hypothetical protein